MRDRDLHRPRHGERWAEAHVARLQFADLLALP